MPPSTPPVHSPQRLFLFSKLWVGTLLGCSLILTSGIVRAQQAQFYVSPGATGNGSSSSNAFGTIAQAQTAVQQINSNMTGDIIVNLLGGTYNLSAPLSFGTADSGTNGHNVIYQAVPQGQLPIISGGVQINTWTLHDSTKNIWQANVSGIALAPNETTLSNRQLYVNGVRAVRANETALTGNTITATKTGFQITYSSAPSAATLMQNWGNLKDIEFVFTSTGPGNLIDIYTGDVNGWAENRCQASSITGTATTTVVTMNNPPWSSIVGSSYDPSKTPVLPNLVENAYELLGQPGEWYLDKSSKILYYIPRAGESMAAANVVLPVQEIFVQIQGSSASSPVHNIQFLNLAFAYATWQLQNNAVTANQGFLDGQATFGNGPIPGNVTVANAKNIVFQGDIFAHLGATGLMLGNTIKTSGTHSTGVNTSNCLTQNNTVTGNVFTDISGNAICLGDIDYDNTSNYSQRTGNTFSDNYIHDNGVEFHGGVGIYTAYTATTSITHNEIANCPYSGMSIGWGDNTDTPWTSSNPQVNNSITYNYVHDTMQLLNDGACIYTRGVQPGSTIAYNYFSVAGAHPVGPGGIYTDEGTSGFEVDNNVITKVPIWMFIWTKTIQNLNIHNNFADTENMQEPPQAPFNGYPGSNNGGNYGTNTADTSFGTGATQNTLITDDSNPPAGAQAIINTAGLEANWVGIKQINVAAFSPPAAATAPTISPNGGNFSSSVAVTLADTMSGASIYYTTDGTTPTAGSTLYTSPFTLTTNATVNAIAVQTGYSTSAVTSATFNVGGWAHTDLGSVGIAGTSSIDGNGTFTVSGSGSDIWYTADQCQYIYQSTSGDFQVVARVVTAPAFTSGSGMVAAKAKGGVMIRETATAGSAQVTFAANPSNGVGLSMQIRSATGGSSSEIQQTTGTSVPKWLKLVRQGNLFSAYYSTDAVTWTAAGSTTVTMASSVTAGLVVTAANNSQLDTATFDHVTVGATLSPMDVGAVGLAGTSTSNASTGVYSVSGSGADIWNTADAFQYDYQNMAGNGQIVARLTATPTVTQGSGSLNTVSKAGIMIRETTAANSTYVYLFLYPSSGVGLQQRSTTGASSGQTSATSGVGAPQYLKLVRSGNTFTGYYSTDGSTWTAAGSTTVTMASAVTVGLAVVSHNTSQLDTATFDNVTYTPLP